jgi:hypothetical protein
MNLNYYLYNKIPGAWAKWTLAVLAVSQADADNYVRAHNRGGKRVGTINGLYVSWSTHVKADCGAVTPLAEKVLQGKL